MRVAIIGAGNMGSALAGVIDKSTSQVIVANPSDGKLERLKKAYPAVEVTPSNVMAAEGADVVVLAVKPWVLHEVIDELRGCLVRSRAVVSVVAGVEPAELFEMIGQDSPACFYMIPNTAVSVGEGMSFICSTGADEKLRHEVTALFASGGEIMEVGPRQMTAGMALASCGIAYAMRYIRAAVQGGVELGLSPAVATGAVARTLRGAAALLESHGSHPEEEIDRVTTPGGLTIKGLNAMESAGFSAAGIAGLKASVPTEK
ncbi:MAG: NAD(P)-binding domain-containing protein [Paramuribaculum sp.]|nr:NAD(P)-binding domain-containing protein [Paramuribaculum sp.]